MTMGALGAAAVLPAPLLELVGIHKSFGGAQALRGADLQVQAGEILGLCGENGAGKSTLLKVLSGVYPAGSFRGEIRIGGQPVRFAGTRAAQAAGIAIVHQELMLVPQLSVADNLFLGREPGRFGLIDQATTLQRARALLVRFGCGDIDVEAPAGSLGIGLQQIVEIVRALSFEARILVLDEPTAALTADESERLMTWLRGLRAAGTTCVYVSHRLDEVFALCDRVTVLRDGLTAGTVAVAGTDPQRVVALMVGREIHGGGPAASPVPGAAAQPVLDVRELLVHTETGAVAVGPVSLSVEAGEVVAVCGAMGAGRTALLSALFGAARGRVQGEVRLDGQAARLDTPQRAARAGLCLVPEDRKGAGLVLSMSALDNLNLPGLDLGPVLIDELSAESGARQRVAEIGLRGAPDEPVQTLSGGNQQKVALGKWLSRQPRVLLLDEPTRGVDIGAREEIYVLIEALCRRGTAVLMASSDLGEVLRLSHRVLVLRRGRLQGSLDNRGGGVTQADIVALSTGAGDGTGER